MRHITLSDTQRKPLGDSGFTYAGLAYQAGIVFGAARKYLDNALDFSVSADNIVDFTLSCLACQILAIEADVFSFLFFFLFFLGAFI